MDRVLDRSVGANIVSSSKLALFDYLRPLIDESVLDLFRDRIPEEMVGRNTNSQWALFMIRYSRKWAKVVGGSALAAEVSSPGQTGTSFNLHHAVSANGSLLSQVPIDDAARRFADLQARYADDHIVVMHATRLRSLGRFSHIGVRLRMCQPSSEFSTLGAFYATPHPDFALSWVRRNLGGDCALLVFVSPETFFAGLRMHVFPEPNEN
ncbi:uncharacterized protein EV422DRAFT_544935 [Fimicolochytrium jonesii]|uniref:uncharacterized protein n=1 Tax=Fimicolochytrium jonesii TaxID=1396493 RepID=UPI0022FE9158|nr:uncharacterized protein EV422DRAFT_544935 [Fimicolochytrium jonesii]KAI8816608.1 hypothetical protein EV422DRAFT_544935 [Fimicolochytrium jonesii]